MSITQKDVSPPDEQGERAKPMTTSFAPQEQQGGPGPAPLLEHKDYQSLSVFTPEHLLREARRQKGWGNGTVPAICVLDPDGDLVEHLHQTGRAHRHTTWACYHTVLDTFVQDEIEFGIVGRVVGASFAVLVAEELFASGCQLLISITSAGQIISLGHPPYMVLIEHALRDEGTSYHYLPPSPYSSLHRRLRELVTTSWDHTRVPLFSGASWTTDAPFRETETMIEWCRQQGILTVEMEAAALYALAQAKHYQIICFAHVTNQMGQAEGDFEKGEAAGSQTALHVLRQTAQAWHNQRQRERRGQRDAG
ncbi:MAG: nucleoside phosphorylase [Chloroflexota bacterium]|nr:nucleoside phosphorylase [Chloroflexota bacterium]